MQGIKVTSISKTNIGKTQISYPESIEQSKIAELLNLISDRIEKQQQLVEALKSYKRGFQQAIFGQISSYIKLKDLISFEPKSTIAAGDSCDNGKYVLYRSGQKDGKCNNYTHTGIYIIANDGGEANFKLTNGSFSYTDHCICFKSSNDYSTILLFNYLQMIAARITYEGFVGSGLKNIDRQYFNNLKIPIIENSQDIAKILITLDKYLEENITLLNNLLLIKTALLQQMFI